MPVETDADRAIFFAVDDFGAQATLSIDGSETQINGIFENDFEEVETGGMVSFAASSPTFHGRSVDLADAGEGDTLTINGSGYVIRVVMNDGTGMTMLKLEAASPFAVFLTSDGNNFITSDGDAFNVRAF